MSLNLMARISQAIVSPNVLLLSLAPQPGLGIGLLHKIRLDFLEAYH